MLNEGVIVCEFASEAGEASSSDDVTNADEASRGNDALGADASWLVCADVCLVCADVWVESEFDEWGCHAFRMASCHLVGSYGPSITGMSCAFAQSRSVDKRC